MTDEINVTADQAVSSSTTPVPAAKPSLKERFKDPARWKKSLTDLGLWFMYGALLTTMLSLYSPGHPIVVGTSSIKQGIYWLDKQAFSYNRGDFVSFPFKPAQEWLRTRYGDDRIFTKQVKGVAGDTIYADDKGQLKLCAVSRLDNTQRCDEAGQVMVHDSVGRPMTPWVPANHQYTLREGEVWVYAPHQKSLDSRYYGPIRTETISGKASPLFLWGE